MNTTYDNIIKHLKGTKTWEKISADLSKITISKLPSKNYAIWYDNVFTGIFINKCVIDEAEPKKTGWKLINHPL